MRTLFTLDAKNYDPAAPLHVRPSVRGIIIRDGKILMVHSRKFDYYKFPAAVWSRGRATRRPCAGR